MPLLDDDSRRNLVACPRLPCPACKEAGVKDYCRTCDEFFRHCACTPHGRESHRTHTAVVLGYGTLEPRVRVLESMRRLPPRA